MSMKLSPPRLWIDFKWTACTSIWLHIHKWKYNIPLKNAKPVLSTCGSFSKPFHEFFTAFSRVFHGLFTFLGSALFVYFFLLPFLRKPWRHDFHTTNNNFRSNTYKTGTLTAAILQTSGTLTSSRQHFFSLVCHQSYCWGNQYENPCTSCCYTIIMLMGGLGSS